MNKIFDINLGGVPFQVDDNAYQILHQYLIDIEHHFSTTPGKDEIVQDIESRLAEMFTEKIKLGKRIIALQDVEEAIAIMGKPEQMDDSKEQTKQQTSENIQQPNERFYRRRLYRNPDDKLLGGVCSGIGAVLNIDTVWVRLAFACSILLLGTGFLLYIILWIIIPEAKSTTEKLEMQGEPINIHNIGKQIEQDAKNFGKHMKQWGNEVKSTFKQYANHKKKEHTQKHDHKNAFHSVGESVVRFSAIVYKTTFLLILLAFILIVLRALGLEPIGNYPEEFNYIFSNNKQGNIILISLLIVLCLRMAMSIIKLLKYVFRFKLDYKSFKYVNRFIGVISFIVIIASAIIIVNDFSKKGKIETEIPIHVIHNKLYVHSLANAIQKEEETFLVDPKVSLEIEPGIDSSFHLYQYSYARSAKRSIAEELARKTEAAVIQYDSIVEISNYYNWLPAKKWRNQSIHFVITIPKEKTLYIHKSLLNAVDVYFEHADVENVQAFDGLYAEWTNINGRLVWLNKNELLN